jgi:hypothetical protein
MPAFITAASITDPSVGESRNAVGWQQDPVGQVVLCELGQAIGPDSRVVNFHHTVPGQRQTHVRSQAGS